MTGTQKGLLAKEMDMKKQILVAFIATMLFGLAGCATTVYETGLFTGGPVGAQPGGIVANTLCYPGISMDNEDGDPNYTVFTAYAHPIPLCVR